MGECVSRSSRPFSGQVIAIAIAAGSIQEQPSARKREWDDIARRKQLIIASAARLAANGFDRLNAEMDAGNIKGALLVPVTGMAIDKVIALSGDTTARLFDLNVNIQPVDIAGEFQKLHDTIRATPKQVRDEKSSIMTQQLALPAGETIAESGVETHTEPRKENR